ncbi:MAG: ATP-dependent DNA helicase, partial [Acidimicrobiales bacterium]
VETLAGSLRQALDGLEVTAALAAEGMKASAARHDGPVATMADEARVAAVGLVRDIQGLGERPGWVRWVEEDPTPVLRHAPIELGGLLAGLAWSEHPAVLTSATLATGHGFGSFLSAVGLPSATTTVKAPSPFDYRKQGVLYVPAGFPDPKDPSWSQAVRSEIEVLIRAAGGRALCLFTSRRAKTAAAEALRGTLGKMGIRVIDSDDMGRAAAMAAFRDEETTCLFATRGWWQGVDVPGPSLSLVVVDRLPFARPDDPPAMARRKAVEDRGGNAFAHLDLPAAAQALAQGVGRLIRSETDKGMVAVLDTRLAEARYKNVLLGSLPPMLRLRSRRAAVEFLTAIAAERQQVSA